MLVEIINPTFVLMSRVLQCLSVPQTQTFDLGSMETFKTLPGSTIVLQYKDILVNSGAREKMLFTTTGLYVTEDECSVGPVDGGMVCPIK